jgi:hypothetical protein
VRTGRLLLCDREIQKFRNEIQRAVTLFILTLAVTGSSLFAQARTVV